jgi:hypothetical protein
MSLSKGGMSFLMNKDHHRHRLDELNAYERKVRSRHGADGIIAELFHRLGTTNRFLVEFGVEEGLECNTAHLTIDHHWHGLLIEGSSAFYAKLINNYKNRRLNRVALVHQLITKENITTLFAENQVPTEFDLLSIDIDGNDYWVWQELSDYRPRVVVIEYNATYPPPQKWVVAYNPHFVWDGTDYYGASLASLAALGKQLGYALLGTDRKGVDAFFLRRDLVPISGFAEKAPELVYRPHHQGYRPGSGPFVEM